MNILKNQKGLTLLELTVATALFATIVLITGNIYQSVVMSQRSAIASQSVQETVRYALEVMSKEIRHAQGKTGGSDCQPAGSSNYSTYNTDMSINIYTGDRLYFQNSSSTCVQYYIETDGGVNRLIINRDGMALPITPGNINVLMLRFYVNDYYGPDLLPGQRFQPSVTLRMTVEMAQIRPEHRQRMDIQTTISSRSYRN